MKKYSILGLVLIAASAVTAAIIPSKANSQKFDAGHLDANATTDGNTCIEGAGLPACNFTVGTGTTDSANPLTSVDEAGGSSAVGAMPNTSV